jgi:hypothetical protein
MNFFVLTNFGGEQCKTATDFAPVDGSRMGDAPRCPVCGEFVGMRPLLPPVRLELESWGSQWGDVAFGPGDQILISERLKSLYADRNLIGFTRFDNVALAKVRNRMGALSDPPDYQLATILRGRAAIDDIASGLVREGRRTCEECRTGGIIKRLERVVFEQNTWAGEDIFYARGLPGTILVSERFNRLQAEGDVAFCLVDASDFSFDRYRRR